MLKQIFRLLILSLLVLLPSCRSAKPLQNRTPNENLIIFYEPEVGNKALLDAAKKYGSEILYIYKNFNGIAVTVPKGKAVPDAIKFYEKIPGVLTVNKDQKMQLD